MGNIDSKDDGMIVQTTPSRVSSKTGETRNPDTSHAQQRHRAIPHHHTPQREAQSLPKIEVNPFAILEIEPTLDETVIKRAYKRLTLKHHPDKGGSDETFDLITKCYVALMNHIEKLAYKEADFQSLKHSASEIERTTQGKRNRHIDHERFDPKLFNEMFLENRLPDPEDEGYGAIMQNSDRLADEQSVKIENRFGGSYSRDRFMSSFEEDKSKDEHKDLIIYEEPQAMMSCNLPFQELGVGKVEDFGQTNKAYQSFSDYRKALSSGSKLIDPSLVDRKGYNNVDHLKAERNNVSYTLSDTEKKRIQIQQARAELEEESRLGRLRRRDDNYEKVYNRLNDLMIDQ